MPHASPEKGLPAVSDDASMKVDASSADRHPALMQDSVSGGKDSLPGKEDISSNIVHKEPMPKAMPLRASSSMQELDAKVSKPGGKRQNAPTEDFKGPAPQKYRTMFFSKPRAVVRVEPRYLPIEVVGAGAYGIVCSAHDLKRGGLCAIKKVENVFEHRGIAKRTLRELILLRHLGNHENILELRRVMRPACRESKNIYIVTDLFETDLASVIRSEQQLTDDHVQFFIYQVLRGLKYIHSANVLHRDLKPRNLLVNSNCDLKICDFGLARLDSYFDRSMMSDYIATRWYRAPEIITKKGRYTKKIDIWAVGCILGELFSRKPLFPSRDEVHQLHLIQKLVGGSKEQIDKNLRERMKGASELGMDLLKKLLATDPNDRPTAEEALKHPYLEELHEEDDEPSCPPVSPSNFAFEMRGTKTSKIEDAIWQEIFDNYPADTQTYPMEEVKKAPKLPKAEEEKKKKKKHERRHSF